MRGPFDIEGWGPHRTYVVCIPWDGTSGAYWEAGPTEDDDAMMVAAARIAAANPGSFVQCVGPFRGEGVIRSILFAREPS